MFQFLWFLYAVLTWKIGDGVIVVPCYQFNEGTVVFVLADNPLNKSLGFLFVSFQAFNDVLELGLGKELEDYVYPWASFNEIW